SLMKETFGVLDSDGTWYLDFGASVPVGDTGLTVGAHYGIQKFEGTTPGAARSNDEIFSYDDWRVSVAYDLGKVSKNLSGAEIGVMYTDTSGADAAGYGSVDEGGVYPKNIADNQVTVWFKKTF
ncbi:MAG TPA: TorF family putative porin, partial [Burkholderiales bacterium]|nr:TorF family putative porin [Burkholderiales bacterium]